MGRRSVIPKYKVLTDADSSSDPISNPTDIQGVDFISYQFNLESTVNANLEIQFCNDDRVSDASVFQSLFFNQPTPLDGSSDTEGLVHIENRGFKHMRLKITNDGGTGGINAWVSGVTRGA